MNLPLLNRKNGSYFICIYLILSCSLPTYANSFYKTEITPVLSQAVDATSLTMIATTLVGVESLRDSDKVHLKDIQESINLSDGEHRFGDFLGTGAAGALIALSQIYGFNESTAGYNHVRTLLWTGASTLLLKGALNRKRPNGGEHSMPSGHTSTAFATATSMAYSYGWKGALAAYPLATLVAVHRMDDNKHWLSDTFAGAMLGVLWARAVHTRQTSSVNALTPIVSSNGWMLSWAFDF